MNQLRHQLAPMLRVLDDDALIDLGNKGLLRRAKKDIERGMAGEINESESALEIPVDGVMVTVPAAGPAQTQCTCPAPGMCRHIITALIALRDQPDPPHSASKHGALDTPDPQVLIDELISLKEASLRKLDGVDTLRRALEFISAAEVEIELSSESATVSFAGMGSPIRYLAGGGVDGMILKATERERPLLQISALLALQRHLGVDLDSFETRPRAALRLRELNETELHWLDRVEKLVIAVLSGGLLHASSATQERAFSLSVSGRGAHLPRMARLLTRLSYQLTALSIRSAEADDEAALATLAEITALNTALRAAPADNMATYRGQHRSQFTPVAAGYLDLLPLTYWQWGQKGRGRHGLTFVFHASQLGRFVSLTRSAAAEEDVLDPKLQMPWGMGSGLGTLLGRRMIRLRSARLSADGRLSQAQECRASVMGEVDLAQHDFGTALLRKPEDFTSLLPKLATAGLAVVDRNAGFLMADGQTAAALSSSDQIVIDSKDALYLLKLNWGSTGPKLQPLAMWTAQEEQPSDWHCGKIGTEPTSGIMSTDPTLAELGRLLQQRAQAGVLVPRPGDAEQVSVLADRLNRQSLHPLASLIARLDDRDATNRALTLSRAHWALQLANQARYTQT
ncbi:MAG: hypothetical protein Alpg2KO_11050 [Alphaproteobacteria bacterium]